MGYPRGSGLPNKEAETAVDVVSYAVHIACQLGAHLIKCKPPTHPPALPMHLERGTYDGVPTATLADRVRLVLQAAFGGKRVVIHSGGEAKDTESVLKEVRQLKAGGSFGSIVGRNAFQRPFEEAIKLLHAIQDIYVEETA
ncbi:MAG: hypothetical protein KatS3mg115_2103 [Candidatus Poribacteria bacterium]|nr:MAG: hypothetical protein KatS3mg115_2103 [Candidatus Poribacteria bacterium]